MLSCVFCLISQTTHANTEENTQPRFNDGNAILLATNLQFFLSSHVNRGVPEKQFRADEVILYGVTVNPFYATNTNVIYVKYRALAFDKAFVFKLRDDRGREVKKIRADNSASDSTTASNSVSQFDGLKLKIARQDMLDLRELFCPDKVFSITNRGVYELEIAIKICVPITNGVPDGAAMQIGPGGKAGHPNADWRTVLSTPLRVKVIKE